MDFSLIRTLFKIESNVGYSMEEVDTAAKLYGGMPKVLKEYYCQLGKHQALNFSQNSFRKPKEWIETSDYWIFYTENQYAAQWGIKKSDLSQENPPVYCSADEDNFEMESETLTDFLNAAALFHAVFGLEFISEELYMVTEEQAEQIKAKYQKYPVQLSQWMPIDFYGNHPDEVIYLCENDDYDLMYASSDAEHFRELEDFMNSLNIEAY